MLEHSIAQRWQQTNIVCDQSYLKNVFFFFLKSLLVILSAAFDSNTIDSFRATERCLRGIEPLSSLNLKANSNMVHI